MCFQLDDALRCDFAVLVGQSKHMVANNLLIGSAREGFSEIRRRLFFDSLIIQSFFSFDVRETIITNEGVL